MSSSKVKAGEAYVELGIRNRIEKGLKAAEQDLQKFSRNVTAFGSLIGGIGLSISAPFALGVRTLAQFDDAMRAAGASVNATGEQLSSMTHRAEELGRTTSFTAVEVANLMTELGRAGFAPDQINTMTEAVLDLARATGTDAVLSAGILSATIRQFGMEAADASRVADVLTLAANASFTSVDQLGEALQYAGPVAADFGMSIEETAAILGTLGNVGIQASEAGTTLRRLLTITGAEAEKLQGIFGVSFVDAAGNARPLVDTLGEVATATNSLGTAARSEKFNEAFGLMGITGASAIGKVTVETKGLLDALVGSQGEAKRTATEMDAGLGGSMRKLASAVEGVSLALGNSLETALKDVIDIMITAVGGITAWIEKNKETVTALAITTASMVGLGASFIATGIALKVAAAGMSVLGVAARAGAMAAGVAWSGISLVFTALTIKSRISLAVISAGWTLAAAAIRVAWTALTGALSVALQGLIAVATAAAIVSPWLAAAATIATAWFGLDVVLATLALGAATAWSASAGTITAAWAVSAGVLIPLSAAIAAAYASSAAFVTTAYLALQTAFATAGTAGVLWAVASSAAWAAYGLIVNAIAIKQAIDAAIVSAAWTVSAALASAAWSAFTTVLALVTTPTALGIAAAGALSAAWTTGAALVSSVWATTWAIIAGPILPIVAAVGAVVVAIGGIVAAAGYAAIAGADFGRAWEIVTKTFGHLVTIINTTFDAIKAALGSGDYATAVQALWLGIQAGFWVGVEATLKTFKWLWGEAWAATKRFFAALLDLTLRTMKAVVKAILTPFAAGQILGKAIGELLNTTVSFDVSSQVQASQQALKALRDHTAAIKAKNDAEKEAAAIVESQMTNDEKRAKRLKEINDLEMKGALSAIAAAKERAKLDAEMPASRPSEVKRSKREEDLAKIDLRERSGQISREDAKKERAAVDTNIKEAETQEKRDDLKSKLDKGEITPGEFNKQMAFVNGLSESYVNLATSIEMEILALEKGEDAAERKRLADEGLNEQQIKDIEALKAKKKALEDLKLAQEAMQGARVGAIEFAADQMEQQGAAPKKQFEQTVQQINKDEQSGKIDPKQAEKARTQAQEQLQITLEKQGVAPVQIFEKTIEQAKQDQEAGKLDEQGADEVRANAQERLLITLEQQGMAPIDAFGQMLGQLQGLEQDGKISKADAFEVREKSQQAVQERLQEKGVAPADIFKTIMGQIQQAEQRGQLSKEDAMLARGQAQVDLQAGMDNLKQEGQALAEALRTPAEKLAAEIDRIKQLQAAGAIDANVAKKAEDKAREDFAEKQVEQVDETIEQEKALGPTGTFSGFAVASGAFGGGQDIPKQQLMTAKAMEKRLAIIARNTAKREVARAG